MKKALSVLLLPLALFSIFIFARSVQALTFDEHINEQVPAALPVADLNVRQFTDESVDAYLSKMICTVGGRFLCTTPDGDSPESENSGIIPNVGKAIAFVTTNPPVQTSTYIADVMDNFGLAQPAYAQGFGFSALNPILQIWKAFRNMAYFLLTAAMVIIGFMIMFRAQINPQTVVTVQQALPKIIVTLILITFSYAIAGFVIDMIYLVIFAVTELFQVFGILNPGTGAETARGTLLTRNILGIGFSLIIGPNQIAADAAGQVRDLIMNALGFNFFLFNWIASALAYLIIAIAIVIALFRTLFALIMTYINIILATIFAPIQLLLNAFPGQNQFGAWLKNLAANAAVFPATAIILLIGAALAGSTNINEDNYLGISPYYNYTKGGWVPPFVTAHTRQASDAGTIVSIIGLGLIMLLPEVPKITKGLFGVEESQIGAMVGAGLQRGAGGIRGAYGFGSKQVQTYQGLKSTEATAEEEARLHGSPDYRDPYTGGPVPVDTHPVPGRKAKRLKRLLQKGIGF